MVLRHGFPVSDSFLSWRVWWEHGPNKLKDDEERKTVLCLQNRNSAIYGAILGYTGVLAALGSVVAGILHNCSGYAGFWPWLLAAAPPRRRKMTRRHSRENAKMRVDLCFLSPGAPGRAVPAHLGEALGPGPPARSGGHGSSAYPAA